jgi:hypothetical protein
LSPVGSFGRSGSTHVMALLARMTSATARHGIGRWREPEGAP